MTTIKKQQIQQLVSDTVEHLGGQRAVATKCGVSAATISQILNNNWENIADGMWANIAAKLGYKDSGWQLVDMFNTKILRSVFDDAKSSSLMLCVSHKAGSGKTAGGRLYYSEKRQKQVFFLQCREWTAKTFLTELSRTLGIEQPRGYVSADDMLASVVSFFLLRADKKPLLILDEADKLKQSALRTLIPLYNETEDRLGVVIMGTDNLSEEIKRGVRYNKKGYDEIDSRLGRKYVNLYGANKKDVRSICAANGVEDRKLQDKIWNECSPREVKVGNDFIKMIDDLRRLRRVVQRERLRMAS